MPGARSTPPGPLSNAVAAIISDEFSRIPMSQRALAPLVGMSHSQLSKYLRGEKVLDLQQLDAICRELGLNVAEIVDAADYARRQP